MFQTVYKQVMNLSTCFVMIVACILFKFIVVAAMAFFLIEIDLVGVTSETK
jgi:hypothetical protein